jgi:2-polyprenyl-3-methyl-5-hydroxy-6-metoxy-1,4-benzoquinol methylase
VDSGASSAVGVDINADALRFANANYANERVRFTAADICSYDGAGRRFDLITCFETIEHVNDHVMAVSNLRRLLAPGGCLLVSSPNRPVTSPRATGLSDRPANPHHVREFVPEELRAVLVDAGFEVDETVFGQRIERCVPSRILKALYRRAVRPEATKDPTVQPVLAGRPRYFALVAHARY